MEAGEIRWKDSEGKKHWAVFSQTTDPWALKNDLPYEIRFSGVGVTRFARVLKTRVHVAVDEGEQGEPVINTWDCQSRFYGLPN